MTTALPDAEMKRAERALPTIARRGRSSSVNASTPKNTGAMHRRADVIVLLEHADRETSSRELPRRDETCRSTANHGHVTITAWGSLSIASWKVLALGSHLRNEASRKPTRNQSFGREKTMATARLTAWPRADCRRAHRRAAAVHFDRRQAGAWGGPLSQCRTRRSPAGRRRTSSHLSTMPSLSESSSALTSTPSL